MCKIIYKVIYIDVIIVFSKINDHNSQQKCFITIKKLV